MITNYPLCQRDRRWGGRALGYSASSIALYGCLFISLVGMIVRKQLWRDEYIDTAMACFKDHGNYTRQSGAMLASFDISACTPPEWGKNVVKNPYAVTYNGLFPLNEYYTLNDWLDAGNEAILEVDPTPGNPGIGDGNTHFVRAIGRWHNRIAIHDPWYGDIAPLVPRYDPATENEQVALYRAVLYEVT